MHPFNRPVKTPTKKHSLHGRWEKMKTYNRQGVPMDKIWATNFNMFLLWAIKNGYKSELVLTRKDKKLGFTPDNCFLLNTITAPTKT